MDVDISGAQAALFVLLAVWEFVWKGFALWRAAQRNQNYWFIGLLVVNSVGLLPILYLLLTSGKDTKK